MGCSASKVMNQPSMVKERPPIATQKRPWPFGYDKVSDYSSDDGSKRLPRKEYGDCTSKEGNDNNNNINQVDDDDDGDLECDDGSPHHPGSPSFRFYIRVPSLMSRDSKMEGSSTVKRDRKRGSRSSITTVVRPSVKFVGVDDDVGKLNNLEQHPTPLNNEKTEMETEAGSTRTSTATRLPGAAKFAAFRTYVVNVATCRTTLSQTDAAPHHQPCHAK